VLDTFTLHFSERERSLYAIARQSVVCLNYLERQNGPYIALFHRVNAT